MAVDAQPRIPLSRERILLAALALADEHGLEWLSMRKLAQALGFEAMSLYNHVASKSDLIDGILDLVLEETEPPAPSGRWDEAIRQSAISVHDALRRHSWAASLFMSAKHIRPARLRYMDSLLRRLRDAGFSPETTYHAYHVIDGHTMGFSMWEISHSSATPMEASDLTALFDRVIPADVYPDLREHGRQHFAEGPHRDVSAFAYGLDLILEGLRKVLAAEA